MLIIFIITIVICINVHCAHWVVGCKGHSLVQGVRLLLKRSLLSAADYGSDPYLPSHLSVCCWDGDVCVVTEGLHCIASAMISGN